MKVSWPGKGAAPAVCSERGTVLTLGLTSVPPTHAMAHVVLMTLPRRSLFIDMNAETQSVSNVSEATLLKSSWDCPCPPVPREPVLGTCAIRASHSVFHPGLTPSYMVPICSNSSTLQVRRPGVKVALWLAQVTAQWLCTEHWGCRNGNAHAHRKASRPRADLLCNSSLVRFKVSFGDTLAVAPVPDFCVFTRLFLPIFWLQRKERTKRKYYISKEQNQVITCGIQVA